MVDSTRTLKKGEQRMYITGIRYPFPSTRERIEKRSPVEIKHIIVKKPSYEQGENPPIKSYKSNFTTVA